jgi:uncharacterized protein with PIN domain
MVIEKKPALHCYQVSMSRIRKAYEARCRALLLQLRARRLEPGVAWLTDEARRRSANGSIPLTQALGEAYEHLRTQVARWRERRQPGVHGSGHDPGTMPRRFVCDAGLGGLARWLRAAGYETLWWPDVADADLVKNARDLRRTLLTTDSLMMQRRLLRDGIVPALWLPPTLTKEEQLALVFRELELPRLPPRCMSCGGALRRAEKEKMRDRIPPRTWRWVDDYFICSQCDQLYWHGTHWRNIQEQLAKAAGETKTG